jgi:lipopolysaccharide transport system ATP-binding protein
VSDIAVRAENLGKLYRLGHRERYSTLRDAIARALAAPFGRTGNGGKPASDSPAARGQPEYIWALKHASFEIRYGEVVGIIGGNGAGKSTLLKILSRITEPTEGEAAIYGRVGSLLEVGTGFHPELTGRENIFLNGAILGMKKAEIDRKFDEIVGFAEVERFIDTPVKHYSSGMYMRLAFAVAAHLESEILLVDEVLAVGDAAFQKKCLGKMGEVAREGRTVLFVSHNMEAVQRLCGRCLLLEHGSLSLDDKVNVVASTYLGLLHREVKSKYQISRPPDGYPEAKACLMEAEILNAEGKPCQALKFGEPFTLRMVWRHSAEVAGAAYAVRVHDARERFLFAVNTIGSGVEIAGAGLREVLCRFSDNVLVPGKYYFSMGCYVRPHTSLHVVEIGLKLAVVNVPYRGDNAFNIVGDPIFALHASWTQKG